MSFGMQRLWERDIYLHTLPMFHANGWRLPYPLAGLGAKQVGCARWTAPRFSAASTSTASP
jgi:hypothetical protein